MYNEIETLTNALEIMKEKQVHNATCERALAITKLQECIMWLREE